MSFTSLTGRIVTRRSTTKNGDEFVKIPTYRVFPHFPGSDPGYDGLSREGFWTERGKGGPREEKGGRIEPGKRK
jgi:hypothetical protein